MTANEDGPPAVTMVSDLNRHLPLDRESQALLPGRSSPQDFLDRLMEKHLDVDAIRVLAYTMPIRRPCGGACCAPGTPVAMSPARAMIAPWRRRRTAFQPSESRQKARPDRGRGNRADHAAGCCGGCRVCGEPAGLGSGLCSGATARRASSTPPFFWPSPARPPRSILLAIRRS